ncbi:MAG: hypothetical protein HY275_09570 [Gemmatimonadetes bacterium]|nr:hypothetical protein [Gemmatimonadota bacterium]
MLRLDLDSLRTVLAMAAALALGACGSANPQPDLSPEPNRGVLRQAPGWYLAPPRDADYLLSASTATSRDLQVAIDKARLAARAELATQMEAKLEGLGKRFAEEGSEPLASALMQQYSATSKAIVSTVLTGSRPRQQQVDTEGEIYRAYVLMELPIGTANAALMAKLKQNQAMVTKFRATSAFKELEQDVARFEASKGGGSSPDGSSR